MGAADDHALLELKDETREHLVSLLSRGEDVGLLTQISPLCFAVHPALPWFLGKLSERFYDGQARCSTPEFALRAWVESIASLGSFLHDQFGDGNHDLISALELERHNFIQARWYARRNHWWAPIISCMQGLRCLYEYRGQWGQWARLVSEIVADYCDQDDGPIPDRSDGYPFVMDYRVRLAQRHEHDMVKAAELQEKVIAQDRLHASGALAVPAGALLDDEQRHRLRSLAVGVFILGQIRMEAGNSCCLSEYHLCLDLFRRIGDRQREAITEFNCGHAYLQLSDIRDLDAAEDAYRRSLSLRESGDRLGISACVRQIGSVHHERFREAWARGDLVATLLRHAQAAQGHYICGLGLCPAGAIPDLVPLHTGLGSLYAEVNKLEEAREQYEFCIHYAEMAEDRFSAGHVRRNIALMYGAASRREEMHSRRKGLLVRAQAYARAALRDFQYFQGRAAGEEAEVQDVLERISRDLAALGD